VLGNLAASVAGLAAAGGVWLLVEREVEKPLGILCAIAVAFHPAMWIASVTTLDPIFGTAFLVLSAAAVSRRRPVLAGILLGLAVGCRATHALAALPLALFARSRLGGWTSAAIIVAVGGIVGGSLFLLPALTYGIGFLNYEPVIQRDFVTGGYKVYRELVGLPVVLGSLIVMGAVLVSEARRHRVRNLVTEPLFLLGTSAVLVLTVPFLILPTDPQYLLPWVPFGVLVLAGCVRQHVVRAAWAAGLLVAAMIPAVIGFGLLDLDSWRSRQELRFVWMSPGQIPEHCAERVAQLRRASSAAHFPYPEGAAVILGRPFMATQLAMGVPERELSTYLYEPPTSDVMLFRLIPPWYFDRVVGRHVFYAEGEALPYLTRRIFGYELTELDARPLELWPVIDRGRREAASR
jgi:hypothetical protein